MTRTRAAAWIAGGGLLAAWLAAAASAPSSSASAERMSTRAPGQDQVPGDLEVQADRLRKHLRTVPLFPTPSRNPFQFGDRRPPAPLRPAELPTTVPEARSPVLSPLTLAGIAENQTSGGVVRTAVISLDKQLFLVKEGESILTRYRVDRIGADAVELRDGVTDTTIRLGLP